MNITSKLKRLFTSRKTYVILFMLVIGIGFAELYTSGALSLKGQNVSGIESLAFDWTDTIFEAGAITFQLDTEDAVRASIKVYGAHVRDIDRESSFDASCMSELESILAEHHVHLWNGFNRHFWPIRILDYDATFSLTVRYKDGGVVKASGYMHFPDDYHAFNESLVNYTYSLFENQKQ